jgi:hypothetical protein
MPRLSAAKQELMSSYGTTASFSNKLCMTAEFFSMNGFNTLLDRDKQALLVSGLF